MRKKFNFRFLLMLMAGIFVSLSAVAQNLTVKGHVQDSEGMPVSFASVVSLSTKTVTNTDANGNFILQVPKGGEIRISYLGYKTVTLEAAETISVTLEDNNALGDAVVIGYGVAKKSDLTGSVVAIKPDSKNQGLVVNAQDMMQGKIAGVSVTSGGGTPGGGADIRIRGGSSLNASNDPLIVIDGVAMDNNGVKGLANPLSMVNPQDIESFTVLKDASATAIYGSRGSNGVIIITTKKGHSGQKPQVSYSGNISISTKKKTIDVMSGDEYRDFINRIYAADGAYAQSSDGSAAAAAAARAALGTANTNWQDEIYRTAIGHDHNVTVTGALSWMPYRVSLGYTNDQGILRTSNFRRYTASVNLNPTFLDEHLTLNLTAKGMYAENRYADGEAIGAALWMDPTQSPYDNTSADAANFGNYFEWRSNGSTLNDAAWPTTFNANATKNPLAILNLKNDRARSRSFIGNAEIMYKIHGFEDLRLHMNLGADISQGKQNTVVSPYSPQAHYYGSTGYDQELKRNLMLNAYAQYYKDITEKHHFDIMAGYEWQHFWRNQRNDYWGTYQLTNNDATLAGTERPHTPYWYKTENYLVSFFGRANYSFDDRYLLTATIRDDGSSRFKDHWALFPSFAFAWKVKNEAFLKNVDALSDLKLRLGYGQTGQQEGIGDYNYFAIYNAATGTQNYYPVVGDGSVIRPVAYDPNLKWETTTTYNAGIDLGFFNQRLTASVDYYYRKTTDLLNSAYVSAGSNFRNTVMTNIGSLKNTGVELAIDWKAIQTDDWFWTLGFNATYNKNEITELIGTDDDYYVTTGGISSGTGNWVQAHAVGHPASSFYVFQQVYDEKGLPLEGVYVDRNADGQITDADRYFYKSPMAPWTFGFTSRLEYKNWDFGFSLRANLGNYVFNDLEAGASNMNKDYIWNNSFSYLANRPLNAIEKNWQTYDYPTSDYFVQNGSFLKCDNITLGYSFRNLFKGGSYDGVSGRVFATANNVFCITKYKGIDPEVFGGIDNALYPRPISFIMGISLNF